MTYKNYLIEEIDVVVKTAEFDNKNQVDELHLMLYPGKQFKNFDNQLNNLGLAIGKIQTFPGFEGFNVVFKRYFLSDAANQAEFIEKAERSQDYALSMVQQQPLNGSKVGVWVYLLKEAPFKEESETTCVHRNGYKHRWSTMLRKLEGNTAEQTRDILVRYNAILTSKGLNLKDHCIRTWIFVQNVDVNYTDVVKARKLVFNQEGMNENTHYISSTCIEGKGPYPVSNVFVDGYSIEGLDEGQIAFLHASTHLSPTILYGVTFERGTTVTYGDRRHIFISGTASIDKNGKIVHPNQIELQLQRTLENIGVLLKEAGAVFADIAQLVIYLRDTADYTLVHEFMETFYPELPIIIVLAPVCRPGWLIEMECIAISALKEERFRNF